MIVIRIDTIEMLDFEELREVLEDYFEEEELDYATINIEEENGRDDEEE